MEELPEIQVLPEAQEAQEAQDAPVEGEIQLPQYPMMPKVIRGTRAERACSRCKARKVRCLTIPGQPCPACVRSKAECVFDAPRPRGRPKKGDGVRHVDNVVRRIGGDYETDSPGSYSNGSPLASTSRVPAAAMVAAPMPFRPTLNVSRPIINELVDLYFANLAPFSSIIDEQGFRAEVAANRDLREKHVFPLLVNICAATAAAMHGAPLPDRVSAQFTSWEDVARTFNAAQPIGRPRELFKNRSVAALQNILLAAAFERSLGSNLAYHLVKEGTQFAVAAGYHRHDAPTQAQKAFWNVYILDKINALFTNEPIALRLDEADASPPPFSSYSLQDSYLALTTNIAMAVEDAILVFRRSARSSESTSSIEETLHASARRLLSTSVELSGLTAAVDPTLVSVAVGSLVIFQKYALLEIYRRYLPLLASRSLAATMAQISYTLLNNIGISEGSTIDLMGPNIIDMLDRTAALLENLGPTINEPFLQSQAAETLKKFFQRRPSYDRLRYANSQRPTKDQSPLPPVSEPVRLPSLFREDLLADYSYKANASDFMSDLKSWSREIEPTEAAEGSRIWLGNLPFMPAAPADTSLGMAMDEPQYESPRFH